MATAQVTGPAGEPVVGSLLLGLYDDAGVLHHIGVASSFSAVRRAELAAELARSRPGRTTSIRGAGATLPADARRGCGRGGRGKDLSFQPLRPRLVAEVAYDHMEGAPGSGTWRNWCGSVPTGTPGPAPTTNWNSPSAINSQTSSQGWADGPRRVDQV